jgi:hypothetical protein
VFAETFTATVPVEFPLCPDEMATHPAVVVAFHAQPLSVVTSKDSLPPADPIASCVRLNA